MKDCLKETEGESAFQRVSETNNIESKDRDSAKSVLLRGTKRSRGIWIQFVLLLGYYDVVSIIMWLVLLFNSYLM